MPPLLWQLPDCTLTLGARPLVMGIVNVTPDSFSDGGTYFDHAAAITHAQKLIDQGADILDIGGESTRPGAAPVAVEVEISRVLPVVAELARQARVPISIDTMKPEVARACLDAGAAIINDVSGFRDPAMLHTARAHNAAVIVMHMQGLPAYMQEHPHYADVVSEVAAYLQQQMKLLCDSGIPAEAICLDPGIGFGKSSRHNFELLANLDTIAALKRPVCLGVSRKGLIGKLTGRELKDRDAATHAVGCIVSARGNVHIWRVHDVAGAADAAKLFEAIDSHRR